VHDWDSTQVPVLGNLTINGQPRKVVMFANRNGFFYTLDRATGRVIMAKPFVETTWAKEIGADGRPVVLPGTDPTPEGNNVCPGVPGGTNWMSPSYNPQTGLLYVMAREQCDTFYSAPQAYREGRLFFGSTNHAVPGEQRWGAVRAIDPTTGDVKWEFKMFRPSTAGTLATAGGLVFTGDRDGYFIAVDARTGTPLWKVHVGGPVASGPITYSINNRQHVAISAGSSVFTFGLPAETTKRETSSSK
jgi:alcohol dehydrogenase (cytochrome c)